MWQCVSLMWHQAAAVEQGISNPLIYSDAPLFRMQENWPCRRHFWFRCVIHAEGDAEFALLSVRMLFEDCSCLVRSEVDIGRFDRFTGDRADKRGQLLVKKPCDLFIMSHVTAWALVIAQAD